MIKKTPIHITNRAVMDLLLRAEDAYHALTETWDPNRAERLSVLTGRYAARAKALTASSSPHSSAASVAHEVAIRANATRRQARVLAHSVANPPKRDNWKRITIASCEHQGHTKNGNPHYKITTTDGRVYFTGRDSACNWSIVNGRTGTARIKVEPSSHIYAFEYID